MKDSLDLQIAANVTERMLEALYNWEKAKVAYSDNRERFLRGLTKGTSEYKTAEYNFSKDLRTTKAISDCKHYREEAAAYAAVVSALKA